jgi:hypothetical protein
MGKATILRSLSYSYTLLQDYLKNPKFLKLLNYPGLPGPLSFLYNYLLNITAPIFVNYALLHLHQNLLSYYCLNSKSIDSVPPIKLFKVELLLQITFVGLTLKSTLALNYLP